jgi:hypothetical protein
MKRIIDSQRATDLLNNGYLPPSGLCTDDAEHARIVGFLKSLLAEAGLDSGIEDFGEIGEVYEGFQNDHMIRAELLSWRMLQNGLLTGLAKFLKTHAPLHAITLTFDIQDEPIRMLESPNITVFPNEIIGGFDLCDLNDTPQLLGFSEAEQDVHPNA